MTVDQVEKLGVLNRKLAEFLEQMQQPALLVSSDQLAELFKEVVETGEWLKEPWCPVADPRAESVLSEYHTLLERLRGVLPTLEIRLRMERAQLEGERSQLSGTSQWAVAVRETTSHR